MKRDVKIFHKKNGGAASVGIIGGADGPTAIFVGGHTEKEPLHPFLRFARFVAGAAGVAAAICLWRSDRRRARR